MTGEHNYLHMSLPTSTIEFLLERISWNNATETYEIIKDLH